MSNDLFLARIFILLHCIVEYLIQFRWSVLRCRKNVRFQLAHAAGVFDLSFVLDLCDLWFVGSSTSARPCVSVVSEDDMLDPQFAARVT